MNGNVLETIETLSELALSLCSNYIARKRFFLKFAAAVARARTRTPRPMCEPFQLVIVYCCSEILFSKCQTAVNPLKFN